MQKPITGFKRTVIVALMALSFLAAFTSYETTQARVQMINGCTLIETRITCPRCGFLALFRYKRILRKYICDGKIVGGIEKRWCGSCR